MQNHLNAAPFKLCAKSLHIMSSSIPVGMFVDWTMCLYCKRWSCGSDIPSNRGKETLPNFGVIVLVIRFVRGVSRTPRARSSNPGVDVVARCIWEEKRCSIWASSVLISSDMKLFISSTFIVPSGTGHSGVAGRSGIERRDVVARPLESYPYAGYCCCWWWWC